ncbi:lytic polysaccharide monooxygenase [Hyaloscypha hepaticicola]|uniref:AA9 family lytic polysaccharide monooxygenase n=1 Tax=Hyaloscypha hepaticicola TaxID=2082293 RepID=A0A2J6PEZ3_9HELO|nr:lytic polysaccharide monooxygenase [Hyaloscypha hepaticicola]
MSASLRVGTRFCTLFNLTIHLLATFSVACIVFVVSGHSIFVQLGVEGTTYRRPFPFTVEIEAKTIVAISHAIRDPSYDCPIQDVTSDYIACNGGSSQPTTPSSDIINVKAGDTIQATWRHTLTSESLWTMASTRQRIQEY